jgi:hypothetical protein
MVDNSDANGDEASVADETTSVTNDGQDARWLDNPENRELVDYVVTGYLVGFALYEWVAYAQVSRGHPSIVSYLWLVVSLVASLSIVAFTSGVRSRLTVLLRTVATFALVIWAFSAVYYAYGTSANFGSTVSRTDAVYIALGNLTAAGTNPFVPKSELARSLLIWQYAVDIILVFFVLGVVIATITSSRSEKYEPLPSQLSVQQLATNGGRWGQRRRSRRVAPLPDRSVMGADDPVTELAVPLVTAAIDIRSDPEILKGLLEELISALRDPDSDRFVTACTAVGELIRLTGMTVLALASATNEDPHEVLQSLALARLQALDEDESGDEQ